MKSNKFWIIILVTVVLAASGAAVFLRHGSSDRALVYQDGKLVRSIALSAVAEPYVFTVENEDGMNVVAVESGRIRILDADCPDKACVRQGWQSGGLTPIVCLPHRLVIELESVEKPDVDAVA